MRPTIREVAHQLNLSITTVSRALDGYADVSAETCQLVVQTALEMGYTPNRAARQLLGLSTPPNAIVCINDLVAFGTMHAVHEQGLAVGRDIAVAGFDGIAASAHSQPPLTTLDQPVYTIARRLVSMLLALITGETLTERQVMIEPQLLIRASTGG